MFVCLMLALGVLNWTACVEAAARLEGPMVVTQVPLSADGTAVDSELNHLGESDWFERARLVTVSETGAVRVLSEGFLAACDPNVALDGKRMLFAAKKDTSSHWRVYEMDLDGGVARPVSPGHLDARSPIYVSTLFTLDSPEPWLTTVFAGWDRTVSSAGEAGASLYNVKLDGTELRRLTYNLAASADPFQMWDGRVVYSAVRRPLEPGAQAARASLFAIHIEGADMELYSGQDGRRVQRMACATAKGLVAFIESDLMRADGGGQLAAVHESRPRATYRRLTNDEQFLYAHPYPWRDNVLLVSRRETETNGTWGIVAFDADKGRSEGVFDSPEYHDLQATPIRARSRPDGHSTVVDTKAANGTFYCLNAYDTDERMRPHLAKGVLKRVRVLEGLPTQGLKTAGLVSPGSSLPFRRLVGEAPIEPDGSFNIEVPASTPLLLQALDERGVALATCGWTWVQPKETRGCIGCHEDPELTPENAYVQALKRPSNQLTLAASQRRTVTFREDIVPILRAHCATADCHGAVDSRLPLALVAPGAGDAGIEKTYAALLAPAAGGSPSPGAAAPPQAGKYVDAGRARTSWLVWQILGTNTARPWDMALNSSGRTVKLMPPAGKAGPLKEEQILTLIQWIDLGAPMSAPPTGSTGNRLAVKP